MSETGQKLLRWNDDRDAALELWKIEAPKRGIDITAPRFSGGAKRVETRVPSDSAAVGAALECALACRCGSTEAAPDPANPLRAIREAAGLSQSEMAERMGVTRGAWANVEKAAKVTEAMVARARKAVGE